MSAGSGIAHSEMNANKDKEVKFLQIWVFPKLQNITPRYEQKSFLPEDRINKILNVVAPDNGEAIFINQDAWFSLGNFSKDYTEKYTVKKSGNGVYVFVLSGSISINGQTLQTRDGLGVWEIDELEIKAETDAEFLLIDIPMQF
jgi:redox-sensitive bicupin YhaK (pirin superfamily)